MFKIVRRTISFLVLFIAALVVYFVFLKPVADEKQTNKPDNFSVDSSKNSLTFVKKVIDGDTFILQDESRVRLLGIDAPESRQSDKLDRDSENTGQDKKTIKILGKRSTEYLKSMVEGKKILLVNEPDYENKDRYGRLLRYAYLEDGTFINGKMVEDGYAQVFRKYQLSKTDELLKMEKYARENKKGLWGTVEGTKQFE